MTRKHLTWCYLGNEAGAAADLAEKALISTEEFMFADSEDRARVRRQIEAALRTRATDRELLKIAVDLKIQL